MTATRRLATLAAVKGDAAVNAQTPRLSREPFVTRGELESLTTEYRHLREEHRRARAQGRSRRHLEHELDALSDRFERLLAHTPDDQETRARWRAHLHHGTPAPPEPEPGPPLVFRGRSETGAELVVRRLGSHELDVLVDGAQVERLAKADELLSSSPGLAFQLGDQVYQETFGASVAARDALRMALESGQPAPADRELLLDGLIDRDLGLTPRGRRALALAPSWPAAPAAQMEIPIEIATRGPAGKRSRERLRDELGRLIELAPRPVLLARGSLSYDENPSLARPAEARATIDLGGRTVRAHATAAGIAEAIDLLVGRLRRALRELRDRQEAGRRGPGLAEPGQWRHGNLPTPRPAALTEEGPPPRRSGGN
jgi:ribosome-associated translation inhibitor RaiA